MFGDGTASGAHDGRFNVLLLGGDSGAGRWGLRPDSMTVASIDAETGRTVLIGLPRNMANFPFAKGSVMAEQFPDGFDCDGCYLNGVSTWAEDHTELFPDSSHPGMDATIEAIEGITGPADQLLGDGEPAGVQGPGRRGRRRDAQRALADPGRRPRLGRHRLHRARASASSTATTRSGSPGPARAPTTTRGWRARSA